MMDIGGNTPLAEAALRYARAGFAVFPLGRRSKAPLIKKEDGGNGHNDATSDLEQVAAWWSGNPNANIGIACGASNLFVIETDTAEADAAIEDRGRAHGGIPETVTVRSSKGRHRWFRTSDKTLRNSASGLILNLDTRGDGGYVVAPPSIHPSGAVYTFLAAADLSEPEIAPLPEWLAAMFRKPKPAPSPAEPYRPRNDLSDADRKWAERAFDGELGKLASAPEGKRNHQLNSAAFALGQIAGAGLLDESNVKAALQTVALRIGLGAREIESTINSGFTDGFADPRGPTERRNAEPSYPLPSADPARRAAHEPAADPETGEIAQAKPSPFADADVARWRGVEPRPPEFIIEGWNPVGAPSTLVADGGAGKTMLMQSKAACIATGRSWLGQETRKGVAFLLAAEDPDSVLHYRQAKINNALGLDMASLEGRLHIKSFQGRHAVLWDERGATELFHQLRDHLRTLGPDLVYVGIDNSALCYSAKENERAPVTMFLNWLGGIGAEFGSAVEISCHTSKTSNDNEPAQIGSGSTAWVWASRSAAKLKPGTPEGEAPELVLMKANHAARGAKIALEWRDGVLDLPAGYGGTVAGIVQSNADREADMRFMACLDAIHVQGRHVSASKFGEFAPKVFATMPQAGGLGKPILEKAMARLFNAGAIEVGEVGRNASRKPVSGIRRKIAT